MKESSTSALLHRLFNSNDLENFFECNADAMQTPEFHAYIQNLCGELKLVPEQVIRYSGIERTYGHQLFNGTRKPSRDKVIQLAFGFALDLDGAQRLLQIALKSPLYPKIRRDAAVIFCIDRHKDFWETQSVLHSLGLTLLGGE
ncbi:hypothetical protein LARV_03813 [Longilinea arvoryzae]|uniref:XRE family transcriptional regulator n=1 Tax=Longilinea arvoryzae TaxID=360412 RepID=A0A0K8MXN1_9CHLR|nr:hypothetical protein [Longilinea arvoryzae]GAP16018.1 hypothetical protein LARV_03813 [Longilinea arvoryzae]